VFEQAHRLPLRLLAEGKINGLRIDHPDGLAYPAAISGCCRRAHLQRARSRRRRAALLDEMGRRPARAFQSKDLRLDRPCTWSPKDPRAHRDPSGPGGRRHTGYDFLNSLNGIFVARENAEKLQKIYARFIHGEIDFQELVYRRRS